MTDAARCPNFSNAQGAIFAKSAFSSGNKVYAAALPR
jgi:hypothetical protein